MGGGRGGLWWSYEEGVRSPLETFTEEFSNDDGLLCAAVYRVLSGYDEYQSVTGQPSPSGLLGKRPAVDSTR